MLYHSPRWQLFFGFPKKRTNPFLVMETIYLYELLVFIRKFKMPLPEFIPRLKTTYPFRSWVGSM